MNASTGPDRHDPSAALRALQREYSPAPPGDDTPWQIVPLEGDGSERRYYRLRPPHSRSLIGVDARAGAGSGRMVNGRMVDENHSFMLIGRHLAARGIPVPRVLAATPDAALYLLDDLGNLTLAGHIAAGRRDPDRLYAAYEPVIDLLVMIQQRASPGFRTAWGYGGGRYDTRLVIDRELNYFLHAGAVETAGITISPRTHRTLQHEFRRLAAAVVRQSPQGILLRDFQSRNIMLHDCRHYVIDFQGARYGPLYYDLAAVLHDPYVDLPDELRGTLARRYLDLAARAGLLRARERQTFIPDWQRISFVRLLQVIGAICFLGRVKRRPGFIEHLPAAGRAAKRLAAEAALRRTAPTLCRLVEALPVTGPEAPPEVLRSQ
ncbi:MAG: phosphotransferase [Deltaproteobacteria bacterium]|nr:phosphotransferase [Candidatus Anaeroferrophillacea bacterium]